MYASVQGGARQCLLVTLGHNISLYIEHMVMHKVPGLNLAQVDCHI